jgi:hypothetical protein
MALVTHPPPQPWERAPRHYAHDHGGVPGSSGRLARGSGDLVYRRFKRVVLPYWIPRAVSLPLVLSVIPEGDGTQWDIAIPVTWPGLVAHPLLLRDFAIGMLVHQISADSGQLTVCGRTITPRWNMVPVVATCRSLSRSASPVARGRASCRGNAARDHARGEVTHSQAAEPAQQPAAAEPKAGDTGQECAVLAATSSAICTALSAAPLRRLSLLMNRARPRPFGTPSSCRMRPT